MRDKGFTYAACTIVPYIFEQVPILVLSTPLRNGPQLTTRAYKGLRVSPSWIGDAAVLGSGGLFAYGLRGGLIAAERLWPEPHYAGLTPI